LVTTAARAMVEAAIAPRDASLLVFSAAHVVRRVTLADDDAAPDRW
jgi:hypothetical protein